MRPADALAARFRVSRAARRGMSLAGLALLAAGGACGLLGDRLLADDFAAYERALARVQETGEYVTAPSPAGPVALVLLGATLLVGGIVVLAPSLIGWFARAGARLPVAARLGVRDAARHRHRTGPATSAIAVAVAGSVVLAFVLAASFRAEQLRHVRALPPHTLAVESGPGAELAGAQVAAQLPDARVHRLRIPLRPLARDETLPPDLAAAKERGLWATPGLLRCQKDGPCVSGNSGRQLAGAR
jgi:putative ABC transport system permease protein